MYSNTDFFLEMEKKLNHGSKCRVVGTERRKENQHIFDNVTTILRQTYRSLILTHVSSKLILS